MFTTLDERRKKETTRTEYAVKWAGSLILTVLLLGSIYLGMTILH